MPELEFSRQVCERDPDYVVVRIRMPRAGHEEHYFGTYTGVRAQHKAMKFVLSSAAGMLSVMGATQLSDAVSCVGLQIEAAVEDYETRLN